MATMKKEQLEFLNWEFGIMFSFGIRTFNEGHKDWDMEEMALSTFNPTELDCDEWLKTASEAGAKYAILVCKHHDGFANWPSAYTEYSVKNTPWKGGKGDVVAEEKKLTMTMEHQLVNHVVLTEEIEPNHEIENFEIRIYPYSYGIPVTVYRGTTIGHKAICPFPTIRTNKVEVVFDKEKKVAAQLKYVPIFCEDKEETPGIKTI